MHIPRCVPPAPKSMKTTIQAVVMLCAAFGNVIVMIAAKADLLEQVDICFRENHIFHAFEYFATIFVSGP